MEGLYFIVPGEPVAKGRPKFVRNGEFTRAITPEKTVNFENLVKLMFQQQCPKATPFPKDTPLRVRITSFFTIPKSVSKKKYREMIERRIRPTKKPDCDNLANAICDALNGIAYSDDSQVVELVLDKFYGESPETWVTIQKIGCEDI